MESHKNKKKKYALIKKPVIAAAQENQVRFRIFLHFLLILFFVLLPDILSGNEVIFPLKQDHSSTCHFYNRHGKKLFTLECEEVSSPSLPPLPVKRQGKWGYVDQSGSLLYPFLWDFAGTFQGNYARVMKDNLYGIIDVTGNLVLPLKYQYLGNYDPQTGLIAFQCGEEKNYHYGYINIQGKTVIPCQFQSASDVFQGFARVRQWDLYGYIFYDHVARTFRLLHNYRFRLAGEPKQSLAYVLLENGFFYLDLSKNQMIRVSPSAIPYDFSSTGDPGRFQNTETGWFGYWNKNLETIIPPVFLEAHDFYSGLALVKGPKTYTHYDSFSEQQLYSLYMEKEYEYFYIDTSGNRITR